MTRVLLAGYQRTIIYHGVFSVLDLSGSRMPLRTKLHLLFLLLAAIFGPAVARDGRAETFRNPRRIPLTVDPYGVTTGDLNGDGRNDIVWIDFPGSGTTLLHILLANAGGQYTSAPDVALPFRPAAIQCIVEDVTGDKRNDLVCGALASNFTDVFLITYVGEGDGTYAVPMQTKVANQQSSFTPYLAGAGDLNGDGLSDVLLMNAYDSGVRPYLADGLGGFKPAGSFQGSFNASLPTVTDVNGDGKLDVVWPAGPRVNLGNGDGTFSGPVQYDPGFASTCALGDVDGDGHLDAACTWYDSGDLDGFIHLTVLHGNRDGSFNPTPLFTRTFGNGENQYDGLATIVAPFLIFDLNGDGYADIVSLSGDGYCVLLGGPNAMWSGQPRQFVASSLRGPGTLNIISIADMDGDGLPDITSVGANGLYITYAQRDGTLSSAPATEVGQVSSSSTLVDVNGDGKLDVVSAGDNDLKLSLGNGDGTFASPQPITTNGNFGREDHVASLVVSGDFDGDGKQDLLATGSVAFTAQNYILFGGGDGTFEPPTPIDISLGKVADLDGDGLSDVYSIQNNATGTNSLIVSLSEGDSAFTTVSTNLPPETVANGFTAPASGPALADFRHTGRLDAVVASFNNVYVLRSKGDGSFDTNGATLAIPALPNLDKLASNDIAAGDFDGDGKPDIAVLVQYGSGIYELGTPTSAVWVFYGNGDGTFSTATLAGTFNRDAQTLTAGDLNGDGLADLVLTSQATSVLIVHALSNRSWGAESDYIGGVGLSPLWITDINKDGRNDLVISNAKSSNQASNSISVLLNDSSNADGTLTAAPEPSNVTYPFTLNASFTPADVSDAISGTVTFSLDGAVMGTGNLSGNSASLAITGAGIAAGTHTLAAAWPGDSGHPAVTLQGSHVVSLLPLTISLAATPTSLIVGGTVTATATFTPGVVPSAADYQFTGAATLLDNGVAIAQQPASRNGLSFTLPSLDAGTHTLSVSYPGDALFAAAQSNTITVTVTGAPTVTSLTATPATSTFGMPVTLTAAVTSTSPGNITGTVSFYSDGNLLSTAPVASGSASVVTTSLPAGTHTLTCTYSGDKAFDTSACAPVTVTVTNVATALTLASSANPAPALNSVTLIANLTAQGKPFAATVLFSVDGGSAQSVMTGSNGVATYTTSFSAGTHAVKAQFSAINGYDASSASFSQVAVANPTTTTLTPPAGAVYQGQPVTFLSTVMATTGASSPNGTVTLTEGATVLAQAATPRSTPGSVATAFRLAVPALATGQHLLVATYTPADGNFLASASQALSVEVLAQSFTLSLSDPTLSIPTEHYKSFSATVQALGSFNGQVRFTCAVPQNVYLTCQIATSRVQLAVDGSATTDLTLDTDALLRFKSSLEPGPRDTLPGWAAIAVALLPLPLGFINRRRFRKIPLALMVFAVGAMLSSTGCGSQDPGHTPPGSYDIAITATGTSAGSTVATTQTVHMQLAVTAEK